MPQQNRLLDEFVESLAGKAEATVSTYQRELRQFLSWVAARPGNSSLSFAKTSSAFSFNNLGKPDITC